MIVEDLKTLPPPKLEEAASYIHRLRETTRAERLAALAPHDRIDWSDAWSDEDLRDFRAAPIGRLEAEEPENPS